MDAELIMTVKQMQDRDAWLKMRMAGIGGSDAGTIVGDNPWKSSYALWLEKTGQIVPEDISDKEPVYWGTALEDIVAKEFTKRTGKRVRRCGTMQNTKKRWMLANVDRLIIGEQAGLECKTTNAFNYKEWQDDGLPNSYYWQCQHYMLCTGLPMWYIAVLIGGQHYDFKPVPRNDEDIDYTARNWIFGRWCRRRRRRLLMEAALQAKLLVNSTREGIRIPWNCLKKLARPWLS